MSVVSAVGAGLGKAASSISLNDLSGGWLNNSSSDSYNKSVSKRQLKLQQRYANFKSALDYEYAKRYAQNSAKWQVEGLKAAGLNPILAATNGSFGTFGHPSSGASIGSAGESTNEGVGMSSLADVMGKTENTAKTKAERERLERTQEAYADTAEQQAENARAQGELIARQVKQVESSTAKNAADTANTMVDTENKRKTLGLNGPYGAAAAIGDSVEQGVKKFGEWIEGLSDEPTSAKELESSGKSIDGSIAPEVKLRRQKELIRRQKNGQKYYDEIYDKLRNPWNHPWNPFGLPE